MTNLLRNSKVRHCPAIGPYR